MLVIFTSILSALAVVNADFSSSYTSDQINSIRDILPNVDLSLAKPADDVSKAMAEVVQIKEKKFNSNGIPCLDMLYFNYHVNDQCQDEAAWGVGGYPMGFCWRVPTCDGFNSIMLTEGSVDGAFALDYWMFRGSECDFKDPSNYVYIPDIFKNKIRGVCHGGHVTFSVVEYDDIIKAEEPIVATS